MLTILFIILKITGLIYVSWWWVLIPIIIDEEASRRTRERKVQEEKERKQASYSAMIKKYSNGLALMGCLFFYSQLAVGWLSTTAYIDLLGHQTNSVARQS